MSYPFIWAAFVACLAVSFVLSGMEAGVFALSRLRVRQQMRAGQAPRRRFCTSILRTRRTSCGPS